MLQTTKLYARVHKGIKKVLLTFKSCIICGDFNLPSIDWSTGAAENADSTYTFFTKLLRDHYLWQIVDFPSRNDSILDLILTSIPDKITEIHGFDDILPTDNKLIKFVLNFYIPEIKVINCLVYNLKKANWVGLREVLTPWDLCFVSNYVDTSWSIWYDFFLLAICKIQYAHGCLWCSSLRTC